MGRWIGLLLGALLVAAPACGGSVEGAGGDGGGAPATPPPGVAWCAAPESPADMVDAGVVAWTCVVPGAPTCADGRPARYTWVTSAPMPPGADCSSVMLQTCASLQGGVCDLCCPH